MLDSLRRLKNALERATEDLAAARVLVDAALRQLEDQITEFVAGVPEQEVIASR
jgi:hypothetical protein